MAEHRSNPPGSNPSASNEPSPIQKEPTSLAEAVRILVVFAVGAGWLTAQEANTLTIALSAVGVLVSIGLTYWTRANVTPMAKPRSSLGKPLVPAPKPPPPAPPTRLAE